MTPSGWSARAEREIVEALSLRAHPVEPRFQNAQGTWREAPVQLVTRAYRGSAIAYGRVVEITGHELSIQNLLFVPDPTVAAPLLGIDLVDLGKPEVVVVGDASSPEPDEVLTASAFPPAGPLPSWCARFFSSTPVFARVPREEGFLAATLELDARVQHLIGRARERRKVASRAHWLQAYLDAHRTEDRGLFLMSKMFGVGWTEEFLRTVLFPVKCPGV